MPVRFLNSAVFEWPRREEVLGAARQWASALLRRDPLATKILCVGSYARGDWGVGSDIDLIVVMEDSDLTFLERRRRYEPAALPVHADLWVYTQSEWNSLPEHSPHLAGRLERELLILADRGAGGEVNDGGGHSASSATAAES